MRTLTTLSGVARGRQVTMSRSIRKKLLTHSLTLQIRDIGAGVTLPPVGVCFVPADNGQQYL